ncbi:hypothetical protein JOC25_002138 [Solibacillus kalamii]|uniref:DUF2642 domain-containing protein n=1 Tax=Solibacillus kalamii TaxID=1748298 RepID=A0ABX3ZGS6_9BACL|nr:DUF2642 domain-containing protein [Solibacillus kalamii]MBM7665646.1 hypothetical protein [Solibacillus kalamii]OUZ38912.1 hypothetical protein CBM15_10540 [Solibacillus kalamii]
MGQLRAFLNSLKGSNLIVTTEYSKVTGILVEVDLDFLTLKMNTHFLYIPLASIENVAY